MAKVKLSSERVLPSLNIDRTQQTASSRRRQNEIYAFSMKS